jgi:hypothetical protein
MTTGGTRSKPCIWFSGFWSQGEGACFEGYWSHAKGAVARIRDYAPQDATLHSIADRLKAIQRRNFYQLAAEISRRGHYYHARRHHVRGRHARQLDLAAAARGC